MTHLAKSASKQRKLVFVGVAILVALLAAYSVYATKRSSRMEAGKDALYKARTTLETELNALATSLQPAPVKPAKIDPKNPPPAAAPVSIEGLKFDLGTKLSKAIPELEAVARDFDGVPAGFDAKMLLGALFLEHGSKAEDFTASAKWFESASANAPQTELTVSALLGLGYAQEAAGQCADAVKTFDKALNYGNTLEQEDLLRSQARCYETLQDTAKAKATYERIVSLFPATESARYAQNKLTSLK